MSALLPKGRRLVNGNLTDRRCGKPQHMVMNKAQMNAGHGIFGGALERCNTHNRKQKPTPDSSRNPGLCMTSSAAHSQRDPRAQDIDVGWYVHTDAAVAQAIISIEVRLRRAGITPKMRQWPSRDRIWNAACKQVNRLALLR
jgi:hypothetical protein